MTDFWIIFHRHTCTVESLSNFVRSSSDVESQLTNAVEGMDTLGID